MSLIYRIVHSPFGKILETIREDDIASRAIGRAINTYRIIVITIAAGIIGAMGVIDVSYVRFTEPNVYNLEYLGLILLAVFGGGPGKYWGAVVAAVVTMIVREAFLLLDFSPTIIGPLRWIVLGSVLVGILIYRPNGLFGKKFIRKNY